MDAVLASPSMRLEGGLLRCDAAAALAEGHDATSFYDEVRRIEIAMRRPLAMLVDIRGLPSAAFKDRATAYRRRREWEPRRVAVLGDSKFQEFVVNFLVAATGHERSRYFTDEASALQWLQGEARAT